MKPRVLLNKTGHILKSNSPAILTGIGVSGVFSTAYLSFRAGYRSYPIIDKENVENGTHVTRLSTRVREYGRVTWRLHIPVAISGTVAIAAIVGSSRAGARRTAAVSAAYSVSQMAFEEYRNEVVRKFGEGKEQQLRDDLAERKIANTQPSPSIIVSSGLSLCCELHTGRYFLNDMETLRRSVNDINARLNQHMYATLDDFYHLIGLSETTTSGYFGWDSDRPLKLKFSTVLTPEGRPCLAFEYDYLKEL